MSKICPVCGYIDEGGGDDNISVDGFVSTLEQKLHEIKQIPHPSFMRSMEMLTLVVYPLLAVMFLITALVAEAGFAWILFGVFALLTVRAYIRKSKGVIGNDSANKKFRALKNEYKYNERLAKRKFGKSSEVSSLLDEISGEIRGIEEQRRSMASKNLIAWIAVIALAGGVIAWAVVTGNRKGSDPDAVNSRIEMLVGDYRQGGAEAVGAEQKRMEIIDRMLSAGEPDRAEDFFFIDCMGEIKDLDCARQIVEYYKKNDREGDAAGFVAKCSGMRYKSDQVKLEEMLTR